MRIPLQRLSLSISAALSAPFVTRLVRHLRLFLQQLPKPPASARPPFRQVPRAAHWVVRSSDLQRTLDFLDQVFGFAPIRHEENSEPCDITCNGRFNNAWSKTMVGVPGHYEDEFYCFEITFNYGVWEYKPDTALQCFALGVPDPSATLAAARAMGYAVDGATITGPDGYKFEVLPRTRPEPFMYTKMRVTSVEATRSFYVDKLGMSDITDRYELPADCAGGVVLGFSDGWQVPLIAVADGLPVQWTSWTGRFAVSMPGEQIKEAYGKLAESSVVHELQELHEKLGVLVIAIVRDDDGYETCLVSSEFFDPSTRQATDWKGPDWAQRRALIDSRAAPEDRGRSS